MSQVVNRDEVELSGKEFVKLWIHIYTEVASAVAASEEAEDSFTPGVWGKQAAEDALGPLPKIVVTDSDSDDITFGRDD